MRSTEPFPHPSSYIYPYRTLVTPIVDYPTQVWTPSDDPAYEYGTKIQWMPLPCICLRAVSAINSPLTSVRFKMRSTEPFPNPTSYIYPYRTSVTPIVDYATQVWTPSNEGSNNFLRQVPGISCTQVW